MPHRLKDKEYIADVMQTVKDVARDYPKFMEFLEIYCGYNTPGQTADPYKISYDGGKRDVILTIKTMQRSDILPETVASFYERNI